MKLIAESLPMSPDGQKVMGADELRGDLDLTALLVRESIQNAWDARDDHRGDHPVHFEIQGYDLIGKERDHLQELLPVAHLGGFNPDDKTDEGDAIQHPHEVLQEQTIPLLVIADRRTVGLCGPVASGRRWDPIRHGKPLDRGQQRFANFVRKSGKASADTGHGDGGSHGVGKNAFWMASRCGTVLIHTRTTDDHGKSVERFIGVIHGNHFYDESDQEFTGRHFVGQKGEDSTIDPLEGTEAAWAFEGLPHPGYSLDGEQVDGTTIFVVAPRMSLGWDLEMLRFRDAIRWQVWPKFVPGVRPGSDHADMAVKLSWNNNDVTIPDPLDDPEIRPYAETLRECVISKKSIEKNRDFDAKCGNPKKDLGHLKFRQAGLADSNAFHLTLGKSRLDAEFESAGGDSALGGPEPAVDFDAPWGQVALIRREPLLLVCYQPIGGQEESVKEEVGVYLSAADPEVERALTAAEPGAHNKWEPKDIRDNRRLKTFANRTLEEIKRIKRTFVAQKRGKATGLRGTGEDHIASVISKGLLGGVSGGLKTPPKKRTSSGGRSKGPSAQLTHKGQKELDGRTVHSLWVEINGVGGEQRAVSLAAISRARDSSGSFDAANKVEYRWMTNSNEVVSGSEFETICADGDRMELEISVASNLRVQPSVKVVSADAS